MAGIDKTYTDSYQDYLELKNWAENNSLELTYGNKSVKYKASSYIYGWKEEDFDGRELPVMNTPTWFDKYLIDNCPCQFVINRLNSVYGDNYLKPEEQRALYVDFKSRYPKLKKGTEEFKEAISNDKYFNCIQLKFGYAVTCHKAQGGQWERVFIDQGMFNRNEITIDYLRWLYTALTRSTDKVYLVNFAKEWFPE